MFFKRCFLSALFFFSIAQSIPAKTVVVLGYGSFYGIKGENPAGLIARDLNGTNIGGVDIVGIEAPVEWIKSARIFKEVIGRFSPVAIIALGIGSEAGTIRLENGYNISGIRPDNKLMPLPGPISLWNNPSASIKITEDKISIDILKIHFGKSVSLDFCGGPIIYKPTLPTTAIVRAVAAESLGLQVVYGPTCHPLLTPLYHLLHTCFGGYLCNYAAYLIPHYLDRSGNKKVKFGFFHIPEPEGDCKPLFGSVIKADSYPYEEIKRAVDIIIETTLNTTTP
jgi:pyrrolidone-carboxylate peptidase